MTIPDWLENEEPSIPAAPARPELAVRPTPSGAITVDFVLDRLALIDRAVSETKDVAQLVKLREAADVLRYLTRKAELERDIQNQAANSRIDTERKLGLVLADMDKATPSGSNQYVDRFHAETDPPTYADMGIDKTQAHRWQTMARLPDEHYQRFVAEVIENGRELTSAAVYRYGKNWLRKYEPPPSPDLPPGLFDVIYADPPWAYSNSGFDQSADAHYPTMDTADICRMRVAGIAGESAVLFLWATSPLLPDALRVMEAWGFEYKASMVWVKNTAPGMGWWVRTYHEFLLIGATGGNLHPDVLQKSVIEAPVSRHSAKPPEVYELIEAMYPGRRYVELFARNRRAGWEVFGNEVT